MAEISIYAGDQKFTLPEPSVPCGNEAIAIPDVGKSTILFQIPEELSKCTITPMKKNGGTTYNVLLYGSIGEAKEYVSLFRMCTKATEQDCIDVYVDTVGGNITTAIAISNALEGSSAKVRRIGLGDVMSAGTLIVDGGPETEIGKFAHFMYHMSSSGGMGNTTAIIETNQQLFGYIIDYLRDAVNKKCITPEEMDMIVNKRQDVFITGKEMAERLNKELITKRGNESNEENQS